MAIVNKSFHIEHFQLKYKTKAQWDSDEFKDYVLAAGELGLEFDTKKFKLGDGTTKWSELDYYSDPVVAKLVEELTSRVVQNEADITSIKSRLDAIEGITTISVNEAPNTGE